MQRFPMQVQAPASVCEQWPVVAHDGVHVGRAASWRTGMGRGIYIGEHHPCEEKGLTSLPCPAATVRQASHVPGS